MPKPTSFSAMRIIGLGVCISSLMACGGGRPDTPIFNKDGDPVLETPEEVLEAALNCTEFTNPDKEPVLLVHGTGTYGEEQASWNYLPWLIGQGFDVCTVTYPDRGMGDQQIAAEYVVHAVRSIRERSGRLVDMIGHSQGGSMPRWAIKWWPSVQASIDDFVQHAAPNHGTFIGPESGTTLTPMPAAFFQFAPGSNFMRLTNEGDETPGDIHYTSIYTLFDELVQPQFPQSTSELEPGVENPNVSNILIQDVCPARPVDHVTIGLTDSAVALLTLDALVNDGPADVDRAGGLDICLGISILDPAGSLTGFAEAGAGFFGTVPPDFHTVSEEPETKPYAQSGS